MDNLTHSLVGLALSRAGLNRFVPYATPLLLLAANAPDGDIVALAGGSLRYFEWHRGYSHSLLFLPLMSMLSVAVVAGVARKRLPWMRALLVALIGVISHLLLDWTNIYGVRFMLPWSSAWYHLDVNSLTDAVLLALLLLAAVSPWFGHLVSSEMGAKPGGRGQGIAVFALLLFVAYDGVRWLLHDRAVGQLESRLYDEQPAIRAGAFPDAYNPLRWSGAVESVRALYAFPAVIGGDLGAGTPEIFFEVPLTNALQVARREEAFHFLQYFALWPVWSLEPARVNEQEVMRVGLTDLRFGRPNRGVFHATALIGGDGKVIRSRFTFGLQGSESEP